MTALETAIKIVGNASELGRQLGLDRRTVSWWRRTGQIPVRPVNRVLEIERLTGGRVTRYELAPDVYPD